MIAARSILALTLALVASVPFARPRCKRVKTAQLLFERGDLSRGAYRVTFVATRGPRAGRSVATVLELRATARGDTSPVTGEVAHDADLTATPLYGWLEGDLGAVSAPIREGGSEPAPDSRDPVRPGVLVHWAQDEGPTLAVATLSNLRTDAGWLDGSGIGLYVRRLDGAGFAGTWGAWGIVRSGSGIFCAERVDAAQARAPR